MGADAAAYQRALKPGQNVALSPTSAAASAIAGGVHSPSPRSAWAPARSNSPKTPGTRIRVGTRLAGNPLDETERRSGTTLALLRPQDKT